MTPTDDVAIFWDIGNLLHLLFSQPLLNHNSLENVHVPRKVTGQAFVHRIRDIVHNYGVVRSFKAYTDCSKPDNRRLQIELHASGVSVVHCPHDGRKDVVDKTMLGQSFPT